MVRSRRASVILVSFLAAISTRCASAPPAEPHPPPKPLRASPPASTSAPAPPKPPTYGETSTAGLAALDTYVWPPADIAVPEPPADKSEAAKKLDAALEGQWKPYERPWLHRIEGAPPAFYVTFVRPDPKRAARVQIVALDARQLELEMAIGKEGPFPPEEKTKGAWPRTGGVLPRQKGLGKRVVAAFNGGFRFDGGKFGMNIQGREFMPAVGHAATMLMHKDGRIGFGDLNPDATIPDDVRSFRQNLDPLVDGDTENPHHRVKWGSFKKAAHQVGLRAKRTGICKTRGGHVLYLWGDDLEPAELGAAMTRAQCDYGIHLDMNIYHVGFVFMSFEDDAYKKGHSEVLSKAMGADDKRYVTTPSPKEFFYVTLRDPAKVPLETGSAPYRVDGGALPSPSWMPAIVSRREHDVRWTFIDRSRVRYALVAGHAEPDDRGEPIYVKSSPPALDDADAARVLAALRLGVSRATRDENGLGLAIDDVVHAKLSSAAATLSIGDGGRLTIGAPGELARARGTKLQVPWLPLGAAGADKGVETGAALSLAVGMTRDGDLLVVERTADSVTASQLLEALRQAGAVAAFAPRGAGATFERAGVAAIARGGADSRLYILAKEPPAATYRIDRDARGERLWPDIDKPLP